MFYTCQKETSLWVSHKLNAVVCVIFGNAKMFLTQVLVMFVYDLDPQNEARATDDFATSHSDWLTLNIGGRLFTTTRYELHSF